MVRFHPSALLATLVRRRAMIKALEFRESTMGNILRDADGGSVASRLTAQGMSATDAAAKAALFAAAARRLPSGRRSRASR